MLLFAGISLQLLLQEGTIIAGGDFYQLPNYSFNLDRYAYAWFQQVGQGVPNSLVVTYPYYYFLSWIEGLLGTNMIALTQLFLFLSFSYFSFLFSLKILVKQKPVEFYIFPSLLYALNNFVITIFSYPWGLTHHFLIYLYLPVTLALFMKIFTQHTDKSKSVAMFMIAVVAAVPVLNNTAFIPLIYLLQLVVFLVHLFLSQKNEWISNILLFAGIVAAQFLIYIWILLPPLLTVVEKPMNSFTTSQALGGENYVENWVKGTSSNFFNVLTLTLDESRYPFLTKPISTAHLFTATSLFVLLVLMIKISYRDKSRKSESQIYLKIVSSSFIIFCVLAVRLYPPFDVLLKHIYLSPFFIFFRSPDKIFMTLSVLYCLVIALLLANLKSFPRYVWIVIAIILVPWITQVPLKMLTADYSGYESAKTPVYSYIINIPGEYYNLASRLNAEPQHGTIISLPYSIVNSVNWSNYPKWHFVGHDVLHSLFRSRYISANVFDNPILEDTSSFKSLLDNSLSIQDIENLIDKFGGKYILWHKDIDPIWTARSASVAAVLNQMVDQEMLVLEDDNDYFSVYQIPDEKIRPIVSVANESSTFTKINPVLYEVTFAATGSASTITFLQSYTNSWKLFSIPEQKQNDCQVSYLYSRFNTLECQYHRGKVNLLHMLLLSVNPVETNHQLCEGYANCWTIENSSSDVRRFAIFNTDHLFIAGLIIFSLLFLVGSALTIFYHSRSHTR